MEHAEDVNKAAGAPSALNAGLGALVLDETTHNEGDDTFYMLATWKMAAVLLCWIG